MSKILCYSHSDHPRIRYVFDWILKHRWAKNYALTNDITSYENWIGPKIWYHSTKPTSGFWLPMASPFYFEQNIGYIPEVQTDSITPQLFPCNRNDSLGYDIPAAVFWMLSRMEEYAPSKKDMHDRFPATASLAYRSGFLTIPVVDHWIEHLRTALNAFYPELKLPSPTLSYQRTYDIDFAWRYLHKSGYRQIRTLGRDLLKEGPSVFYRGVRVLTGLQQDPYDLYKEWAKQAAMLFFPVGDPSSFDLHHSWREPAYQALIRTWAANGCAGIHPSYGAFSDSAKLAEEVHRFQKITGILPPRSRQHFLRLNLPHTYRYLLDAGITEDWTMGYADAPGFRAGTAYPFPWYDISREVQTDLTIHPFQVMDVTLNHYLKLNPAQASALIHQLYQAMANTGGHFVTLWHNNAIACTDRNWKGWENVLPTSMG